MDGGEARMPQKVEGTWAPRRCSMFSIPAWNLGDRILSWPTIVSTHPLPWGTEKEDGESYSFSRRTAHDCGNILSWSGDRRPPWGKYGQGCAVGSKLGKV